MVLGAYTAPIPSRAPAASRQQWRIWKHARRLGMNEHMLECAERFMSQLVQGLLVFHQRYIIAPYCAKTFRKCEHLGRKQTPRSKGKSDLIREFLWRQCGSFCGDDVGIRYGVGCIHSPNSTKSPCSESSAMANLEACATVGDE